MNGRGRRPGEAGAGAVADRVGPALQRPGECVEGVAVAKPPKQGRGVLGRPGRSCTMRDRFGVDVLAISAHTAHASERDPAPSAVSARARPGRRPGTGRSLGWRTASPMLADSLLQAATTSHTRVAADQRVQWAIAPFSRIPAALRLHGCLAIGHRL